jgi:hypothetical protein
VPEIVLSTHGRYELVQTGGGWELRERVEARRRVRWTLGGLLLGAAAVISEATHHPVAAAPAVLAAALVIAGLRKKGRRLHVGDTEISWDHTGDDPARALSWPRARVASVRLERGSRLADPKLRRRRPAWMVRLRSREGDLHPATFAFSTENAGRGLGDAIARRLGVPLEEVEAASAGGASVSQALRRAGPRNFADRAPKPGRLDPR